ncbi:hypothetical protein [Gemmiger sp.]
MFKKILCGILSAAVVFYIIVPVAFADNDLVDHEHKWISVPIGVSGEFKGFKYEVSAKQCSVCKLYDHVIKFGGIEYNYLSMTADPGADGMLQSILLKLYGYIFGANASTTQVPADESKDLPGYADDKGTPSVNNEGNLTFVAKYRFSDNRYHFVDSFSITDTDQDANKIWNFGSSSLQIESYSEYVSDVYAYGGYVLDTQNISGIFYIPKGTTFVYNPWGDYNYHDIGFGWNSFETDSIWSHSCDGSKQYLILYRYNHSTQKPYYTYANENGTDILFNQDSHLRCRYVDGVSSGYPDDLIVYCRPTPVTVNKQTNITINNNTWNGNIYTDNSTNLTYIYPQYTTVNEKNETVTNISNTPIIYNNETKQYYTYDQTTKNYYYINYGATPTPTPAPTETPTPSPEPTEEPSPSPTPTPGGSGTGGGGDVSTPETGKPGNSSGSSWWDKLLSKIGDAIIDGLLGAVSAVLKLIFKLFSTILSWIIWAVSRVFDLLPFLPPGLGGLLVGGVVVCFVIGIIKFIRG